MTNTIPQCDSTTVHTTHGKVRCVLAPGHTDGAHRCAFKSWPESASHAATAVCGCATNAAGLHAKECPIWINVGPNLAQRHYVRRDSRAERNTLTGCLTGHGVEQVTAALIRDDSIGAIIIREQVKIYCAWQDDPTQTTTAGTDACYELLMKALIVHGAANTHQDSDRVLHKLVQAYRNGVRL